jgi:hypothetical protein
MKTLSVLLLCVTCGVTACSKPESKSEPAPAASKPAEAPKVEAPKVEAPKVEARPVVAADDTAASFFAGAPPADVKLGKAIGKSPSMKIADGWAGDDNKYSAMLFAEHKASGAALFHHEVGPSTVTPANRDFWIKAPLGAPSVKWEADAPGKLGASEGQAAKGTGKCGKADADFYSLRYTVKGTGYLAVACIPKNADAAVKHQAEAMLRSVAF